MSSLKKYKSLKNINKIKSIKLVLGFSVLTLLACWAVLQPIKADERADIQSLVKELDYLIEVSVKLKRDYGNARNQRVRFNYQALINQLKTTRQNTAAFFNEKGISIQTSGPSVIDQNLYQISK